MNDDPLLDDDRRPLVEIADELGCPLNAMVFIVETCDYHAQTCMYAGIEMVPHVTAQEFFRLVRDHAIVKFGSDARETLESWGLSTGDDVGRIVFALVEHDWMQASESDSPLHFRNLGTMETLFRLS